MASALAFSWVDQFCSARDGLNEVEDELGELSAMLADVADAIVDHPGGVSDTLGAWPAADRLRSLIDSWTHYRTRMQAAWDRLSERERRQVGRMPPFGARDPSRAFV